MKQVRKAKETIRIVPRLRMDQSFELFQLLKDYKGVEELLKLIG